VSNKKIIYEFDLKHGGKVTVSADLQGGPFIRLDLKDSTPSPILLMEDIEECKRLLLRAEVELEMWKKASES